MWYNQCMSPHHRITCPYPGCTKIIRARNTACRTHRDWSAVSRPPTRPEQFKTDRDCRRCGNRFRPTASCNFYCPECRTPERRERQPSVRTAPFLQCERCGIQFRKRRGHVMKYCSQECRYLASRKEEDTLSRFARRGYQYKQWRNAVIERDGRRCQRCGSAEYLQAHHLQAWKDHPDLRYDLTNGITLCTTCHEVEHGMRLPRVQKRFMPTCETCGTATKGRAPLCKSCSMKHSQKAQQAQAARSRNKDGRFT